MHEGQVLFTQQQIADRVHELGAQIARDYRSKDLLLVGILKGSVPFLADLMRAIPLDLKIDFMSISSYGNATHTSGVVQILKDLDSDIRGKDVLIVEDIVDSGLTLSYLKGYLASRNPASVRIVTMLDKPSRRKKELIPDYIGFTVEDVFIVGYGMDAGQRYRNLPYISYLEED